jgi:hypothetical protein
MTDSQWAERPICLVLMPMYAGFEEIRATVARVVDEAGFEMRRLEVEIEDSAWLLWLLDSVDAADVVLADLTDHNPFVMYELGCAHHRQLPTALIVNARDQRLPATVRGAVCTAYGYLSPHFENDLAGHLRDMWSGCMSARRDSPARTSAADLYRMAQMTADEFDRVSETTFSRVGETAFRSRLAVARRRGTPDPRCLPDRAAGRCLLTLLFVDSDQVDIMRAIGDWSFERRSHQPAVTL